MRRWRILLALVLLGLLASVARGDISVASKNIQNLGWGENKSVHALARLLSVHDLVAIQELMNPEVLRDLEAELEDKTGESWSTLHSDRLGHSRYRERYAFLWRDSTVEYRDGAVVYIDDANNFARPPFSARFRSRRSGRELVLATVHVTYGRRIADRTPEIAALRSYWDWLADVYPETLDRRLLIGDFNLRPGHNAWEPLREVATPLIPEEATTLSTSDREYANLYDFAWVPREHGFDIRDYGMVRFPQILSESSGRYWSHEKARRHVSDHAPIFVDLGHPPDRSYQTGPLRVPNRLDQSPDALGTSDPGCIDLNAASRDALTELLHVGPARADAIVNGRPWGSLEDLRSIQGMGPARVQDLRDQGTACELP